MQKKGRYYFLTFTSAPSSPRIEVSSQALKKWLKRHRPDSSFIYVLTDEGNGVIHMVLRLGKHENPLDKEEVNQYWFNATGARHHPDIRRVIMSDYEALARYISDQRTVTRLAGEFMWQDQIIKWAWTKGWIPTGHCKVRGRAWAIMLRNNTPVDIRDEVLKDMLVQAFNNE